jgi:hypothetical protein
MSDQQRRAKRGGAAAQGMNICNSTLSKRRIRMALESFGGQFPQMLEELNESLAAGGRFKYRYRT